MIHDQKYDAINAEHSPECILNYDLLTFILLLTALLCKQRDKPCTKLMYNNVMLLPTFVNFTLCLFKYKLSKACYT